MSDYIYGSSLRAAKSKANYLFEGDFRRRPNQNLSGASRSMARVELLQEAAEQRQSREDHRRREQSCIKIQSVWRGYKCRELMATDLRSFFDQNIDKLTDPGSDRFCLNQELLTKVTSNFVIFYHCKKDQHRLRTLLRVLSGRNRIVIGELKRKKPNDWIYKLIFLLRQNIKLLSEFRYVRDLELLHFFEDYTKSGEIFTEQEAAKVWQRLTRAKFYTIIHKVIDKLSQPEQLDCLEICLRLIRYSLDFKTDYNIKDNQSTMSLFFQEYLKGPHSQILSTSLTRLLNSPPEQLKPSSVLYEFNRARQQPFNPLHPVSPFVISNSYSNHTDNINKYSDAVWICYYFVLTIHHHLDKLKEEEKLNYIEILSDLIAPAEYLTNVSLIEASNNQDDDDNHDAPSSVALPSIGNTINIHNVITKLVDLINEPTHVDNLKSIILKDDIQLEIQNSVVRICNLMLHVRVLAYEHLTIYNCRLLYTIAFSKEFLRSLWKSIITCAGQTLYGTSTPIYLQLTRGDNISNESWKCILPKLRLFCSLCSYLIPTLDDEEFYTQDENSFRLFEDDKISGTNKSSELAVDKKSFMVDREVVNISAILRDLCVGFVEILYQGKRQSTQQSKMFDLNTQDQVSEQLSFQCKDCFKALVRLVCQLHAKDSRKQFCPEGHWICPGVVIPANRVVDFKITIGQQGRLLNQLTEDKIANLERLSASASEIKTILILQEIPFTISFHDRVHIFHQLLRKEKQVHQPDNYHFGLPGSAIQVQVRRNYIYEDAFEKLSPLNEPNLKLPLKVSLINALGADEAGIDGGGLTKEFLGELLKTGFDPMRGFFKSTKENLLYPNSSANVLFASLPGGYEVHYEFLGRMLGKAIFEKIMVELPLANFFLAKLLALEYTSDVDLHNLESLDPILYKNLVYLKNYSGDVADLNLDFSISNNELDEREVVELKPGGSSIAVTNDNKIEYVHLVADYRLNKQIKTQCVAFRNGLAQLVELDYIRMFDPHELQILISGAPTMIDTSDWRRHTIYANGYSDECEAIILFWRVVENLNEDQKRKLLKFATSCSLPPLLGFKDLVPQFAIAPSEGTRLPTASTCMNLLKLPECEDESTMRSKLLYAIESNSGFELS